MRKIGDLFLILEPDIPFFHHSFKFFKFFFHIITTKWLIKRFLNLSEQKSKRLNFCYNKKYNMLESFLDFKEIQNRPHMMLIWAVIISSIAVLISAQISYKVLIGETIFNLSGLFSVLFTIIPAAYFLTVMIKREEALEEKEIIIA